MMGGRGSSSGISDKGRKYGTEYTTLHESGNTKFDLIRVYRGLQLQLVVYMDAAMEMLRGQHPKKEILPGGIQIGRAHV